MVWPTIPGNEEAQFQEKQLQNTPSIHLCKAYFCLAQRPREALPSLVFLGKKQPAFIADSITLCMCFLSRGMHAMNYCRADSRSVTPDEKPK